MTQMDRRSSVNKMQQKSDKIQMMNQSYGNYQSAINLLKNK